MLEQVSVKELEDEALMVSEVNVLVHPHDVVLVIGVFLHQELQ